MVKIRNTGKVCPVCGKGKLQAVELPPGHVSTYRCPCSAEYDAVLRHDFEKQEHSWYALHRNPEFWKAENLTIEDGLQKMLEKERAGIPEHLGVYFIEKIEEVK